MSEIKRPWTPGPWLVDVFTSSVIAREVPDDGGDIICCEPDAEASADKWHANARLISAAPEMAEALLNFEIKGPDADGLVWLILHGRGTTGKGMLQIGHADTLIAQVAVSLEGDRLAALRKAGIEGV